MTNPQAWHTSEADRANIATLAGMGIDASTGIRMGLIRLGPLADIPATNGQRDKRTSTRLKEAAPIFDYLHHHSGATVNDIMSAALVAAVETVTG